MKFDLHTHYYPESFFQMIRDLPSEFSFDKDPTGRTIIKFRSARFFGITAPMSDPEKRLEDMGRVGIDVEVLSLSTPNVFFAGDEDEVRIARTVNDAYAELIDDHAFRPSRLMRAWAIAGILCMTLAGCFYIYTELYLKYLAN